MTFGNTEPHRYFQMTFETLGMYLKSKTSNFLQFDTAPANPRIAGTGGQIVFYDSDTNAFNSIQVKNVYNSSDIRAKSNIKNLNISLSSISILSRLRPVTYSFTDNSPEPMYKKSGGANQEIGLIAQEVETVLPSIVLTDPEGKKLINYTALIPLLIDAVKELKKEVDELKKEKELITKKLEKVTKAN